MTALQPVQYLTGSGPEAVHRYGHPFGPYRSAFERNGPHPHTIGY